MDPLGHAIGNALGNWFSNFLHTWKSKPPDSDTSTLPPDSDTSTVLDNLVALEHSNRTSIDSEELRHRRCLRFESDTTKPTNSDKPQSILDIEDPNDNDSLSKKPVESESESDADAEVKDDAIDSLIAFESELSNNVNTQLTEDKCVYPDGDMTYIMRGDTINQIGWSTCQYAQ